MYTHYRILNVCECYIYIYVSSCFSAICVFAFHHRHRIARAYNKLVHPFIFFVCYYFVCYYSVCIFFYQISHVHIYIRKIQLVSNIFTQVACFTCSLCVEHTTRLVGSTFGRLAAHCVTGALCTLFRFPRN